MVPSHFSGNSYGHNTKLSQVGQTIFMKGEVQAGVLGLGSDRQFLQGKESSAWWPGVLDLM